MSHGTTKGVPIDVDGTLAANADTLVASQRATKTYVDAVAAVTAATASSASSAVAGAAPLLLPTTDARNVIQPNAATVTPLTLRGYAGQSDPLLSFENSASTVLSSISPTNGAMWVRASGTILYGYGGAAQQRDVISYNSANEYASIISNSSEKLRAPASGGIQVGAFSTTVGTVERLFVYRPTTMDNSANSMFCPSATTSKPLVIQGLAAQSANLTEWQNSSGTVLASVSASGVHLAAGGTAAAPGFSFEGDSDTGFYRTSANNISLSVGGVQRIEFSTYEINTTTSTLLRCGTGSGASPSLSFYVDPDTGVYSAGTNVLGFTTGGVARWTIDASGHFLTFADNTYDIGATAATRPRSLFLGTGVRTALGSVSAVPYAFDGDTNTGTYSPGADAQSMVCGGVAQLDLTTTTLIVNEGGADFDFRVESDTDANNLFSDGGTNRVGIGTGAPSSKLDVVGRVHSTVGYTSVVQAHGAAGATEDIDVSVADAHTVTLDQNCALTFSGAVASTVHRFVLVLTQSGAGSFTVTWPGTVLWPGGTDPTLSTAAGSIDDFTFITYDGGTTWHGFFAGENMS